MDDMWTRIAADLLGRLSGPMKFRLLLQPIMASSLAIKAGRDDARLGMPPYFWSLLSDPAHRRQRLLDGWKSVGKVLVLAIVLDIVYQVIVARFVYVGEAFLVAIILAIVPYVLVRGVTRFATKK